MNWEFLFMYILLGFYTAAIFGLIFIWYFRAKLDYMAKIVMAMSDTLEKVKQLRRKENDEKCSTSSK